YFFFFFQAEDGIRDYKVTGVQTCALPILLETLDRVVNLEMVADVPLGSFLSGGVDSSAIVALMKRHSNGRPIETYTIGMEAEDQIGRASCRERVEKAGG